jgi:hypothetical protein
MLCGLTSKVISSLVTTWPLGTVKLLFPPTVMAASGEAGMPLTPAAPPAGSPTEPAVMGRSDPPKVLEIVILIFGAPTDMWRVWRSVASRRTPPELYDHVRIAKMYLE